MKRRIGFPTIMYAPEGDGGGGDSPSSAPASASAGSESSSAPSGAAPSAAPSTPDSSGGTPTSPVTSPAGPPSGQQNAADPFADWSFDEPPDPVATQVPETPPATVPPVAPQAQPQTPATAQPASPAPAAQPQAQPSGAAPPTTPSDGSPPRTPTEPAELAAMLQAHEADLTKSLAQQMFALSSADVEALDTDAAAHVPQLLARVYLRSQVNAMNFMAQYVPRMVQRQLEIGRRNDANEGKFYSAWPQIDKGAHHSMVREMAHLYRQMHPQATLDQLIKDVGPLVMLKAGIPLAPMTQLVPAVNGQNGHTQVKPSAVRPPPPSPFVPVVPGAGGPGTPQPGLNSNPWDIDPNAMDD